MLRSVNLCGASRCYKGPQIFLGATFTFVIRNIVFIAAAMIGAIVASTAVALHSLISHSIRPV